MVAMIRRISYYFVTAFCLTYLINVLQDALHDLLLRVGMSDVITLGGLLDQISSLPIFANLQWTIIVFVIGVIFWLLVRHDRKSTYDGSGNAVRAFFLAGLTAAFGLRILLSVILIVRNVDTLGQSSLPIAASLAAVIAWAVALGLVELEWAFGGSFDVAGQKIAMFFAYLGQWILVIMVFWAIAQTVQSLLQTLIAPLPLCSRELDITTQIIAFISRLTQQCTDIPPLAGSALTMILILLTLALYARWGARYQSARISNVDAIIGAAIAGLAIMLNSVLGFRLLLDIVTGHPESVLPQSLLSTPGSVGIASYPFTGSLIAGFCVLGFYLFRQIRRQSHTGDDSGIRYGVLVLSFPVGIVFLAGACLLLGHVFTALLYRAGLVEIGINPDDWSGGLMLFLPGLLWGGILWPLLHKLGRPKAFVSLQGRIYVMSFLILTGGAMIVSLVFFVALVASALIGSSIDPTNHFAPYMIAVSLVTYPFAHYYYGLMRRQQSLRA